MITFRATPEEKKQLEQLAEIDGVSSSDAVRMLIRRAHRKAFPSSAPATGAKGKRGARRK